MAIVAVNKPRVMNPHQRARQLVRETDDLYNDAISSQVRHTSSDHLEDRLNKYFLVLEGYNEPLAIARRSGQIGLQAEILDKIGAINLKVAVMAHHKGHYELAALAAIDAIDAYKEGFLITQRLGDSGLIDLFRGKLKDARSAAMGLKWPRTMLPGYDVEKVTRERVLGASSQLIKQTKKLVRA
jgi:hypothetical protein